MIKCRAGCGACCIAPSINSPLPGMPEGKPAGVRCAQLNEENACQVFNSSERPGFCHGLKPDFEMCGTTKTEALAWLTKLEHATSPQV